MHEVKINLDHPTIRFEIFLESGRHCIVENAVYFIIGETVGISDKTHQVYIFLENANQISTYILFF